MAFDQVQIRVPRRGYRPVAARLAIAAALVLAAWLAGKPVAPRAKARPKGRIVVFVVDSLSAFTMKLPPFTRLTGATHGRAVRSEISWHGSYDDLITYQVDDGRGRLDTWAYLNALATVAKYALDHPDDKIIVNISLGSPRPSRLERRVIDRLLNQGVIVVAAAGNDDERRVRYPAAYPGVIAVAASKNGRKAPYSNCGPAIAITADGTCRHYVQVTTVGRYGAGTSTTELTLTGTSFAAPKVAGVISRMLRLAKGREIDVRAVLEQTASPMDSGFYRAGQLGAGLLSQGRALRRVEPMFVLGPLGQRFWRWLSCLLILGASLLAAVATFGAFRRRAKRRRSSKRSARWWRHVPAGMLVLLLVFLLLVERTEAPTGAVLVAMRTASMLSWPPVLLVASLLAAMALTSRAGRLYARAHAVAKVLLCGAAGRARGLATELLLCDEREVTFLHRRAYRALLACGPEATPFVAHILVHYEHAALHGRMRGPLRTFDADLQLTDHLVGIGAMPALGRVAPVDDDRRCEWAEHLIAIAEAEGVPLEARRAAVAAVAFAQPRRDEGRHRVACALLRLAESGAAPTAVRAQALGALQPVAPRSDERRLPLARQLLRIAERGRAERAICRNAIAALKHVVPRRDGCPRELVAGLLRIAASTSVPAATQLDAIEAIAGSPPAHDGARLLAATGLVDIVASGHHGPRVKQRAARAIPGVCPNGDAHRRELTGRLLDIMLHGDPGVAQSVEGALEKVAPAADGLRCQLTDHLIEIATRQHETKLVRLAALKAIGLVAPTDTMLRLERSAAAAELARRAAEDREVAREARRVADGLR